MLQYYLIYFNSFKKLREIILYYIDISNLEEFRTIYKFDRDTS